MITDRNQKVVFGVGETLTPGVHAIVLGIPKGAWGYMREGRTHSFDLTKAGLPIQIIMFGGATHEECLGAIEGRMAGAIEDRREEDFAVLPPRDAFVDVIRAAATAEQAADAVVALLKGAA